MTDKLTDQLLIRVSPEFTDKVSEMLNELPRSKYPTKAHLIRALLELGFSTFEAESDK